MSWENALLTSDATPAGLSGPRATPATRRFDVYRNNVMSSLVNAMRDGFVVVHRLVGEEFFAAMATEYVRRAPPTSPCLTLFGADFSEFIEAFPPAASVPYLADIARLEYALRSAYHAADVAPLPADALARDDIADARLTLAPAVRVIRSDFPIYAIWRANIDRTKPSSGTGAQCVLVTRPDWDPIAEPISPEDAAFVEALPHGSFGEAASRVADLAPIFSRLVARKSITGLEMPA